MTPRKNIFHKRHPLVSKLNNLDANIPIIVTATTEELTQAENHFKMTEDEKYLSRLQLYAKKGKLFGFNNNKPVTKISGLTDSHITLYGKANPLAPASIMQNEEHFLALIEKANQYLGRVLKVPINIHTTQTYLTQLSNQLFTLIDRSSPHTNEIVHIATMERELSDPNSGKNQLTAQFSKLIITELRKKLPTAAEVGGLNWTEFLRLNNAHLVLSRMAYIALPNNRLFSTNQGMRRKTSFITKK